MDRSNVLPATMRLGLSKPFHLATSRQACPWSKAILVSVSPGRTLASYEQLRLDLSPWFDRLTGPLVAPRSVSSASPGRKSATRAVALSTRVPKIEALRADLDALHREIARLRDGSAAAIPRRCHGCTSARLMPIRFSSSLRWYCGCVTASSRAKGGSPGPAGAPDVRTKIYRRKAGAVNSSRLISPSPSASWPLKIDSGRSGCPP